MPALNGHELVGKLVIVTNARSGIRTGLQKYVGRNFIVRKAISRSWVELNTGDEAHDWMWDVRDLALAPSDSMAKTLEIADKEALVNSLLELAPALAKTISTAKEPLSYGKAMTREMDREVIKSLSTTAPRTTYMVDVGEAVKSEQTDKFLKELKYNLKAKKGLSERWNPMAMDEDVNIPIRSGSASSDIQLLSGVCELRPQSAEEIAANIQKLQNDRDAAKKRLCSTALTEAGKTLEKILKEPIDLGMTRASHTHQYGARELPPAIKSGDTKKSLDQELREIDSKYDAKVSKARTDGYIRRNRMAKIANARADVLANDRTDVLLDKYLAKNDTLDVVWHDGSPIRRYPWVRAGLITAAVGAMGAAAWFMPTIIWG